MVNASLFISDSPLPCEPYNNLTLTCIITKPQSVVTDIALSWTHNGVSINDERYTVSSIGNTVMSTIEFTNSSYNDSGVYNCQGSLHIPRSLLVNATNETSVVIKCKYREGN